VTLLGAGGWLAAVVVAVAAWRLLNVRMEAVARACHELRGPLTAARLGLQLGSDPRPLSAARLRAIDLELGRASLALDDLGAARGRRPLLRRVEEIDVRELIGDSVEAWRATADRGAIELREHWSGPDVRVCGDRLRLAQATGNLIANAIEHGAGTVEVRGRWERGCARIEVCDGGPGLPAPVAQLARQAQGGRGRRGRGLAIATAVAEAHGGRLAAAPAERGARLVLEIPASQPRPVRTPAAG
jgi:signal transduction histidine kinase